jgi:threonine/homoserine/homoserine lactone efflux protein
MTYGRRATTLLVAAVALGDSTGLSLSLLGLGTLLTESSLWFDVVKWAGALYLIYLGSGLLGGRPTISAPDKAVPLSPGRLFVNMYVVTALNPKGVIFYVGFLPQFIDPTADVAAQLWVLGATFIVLATLNAAFYTAFAFSVRHRLSSTSVGRAFHLLGGSVLIAAGVWALI